MKICGEKETNKKTTANNLEVGDIFSWGTNKKDHACVKLENGTYITIASESYPQGIGGIESISGYGKITFYPNACITLGDPE